MQREPDARTQWEGYCEEKKAQLLAGLSTGRMALAEDIANAVLFLASEQDGAISGQVLSVDGGRA